MRVFAAVLTLAAVPIVAPVAARAPSGVPTPATPLIPTPRPAQSAVIDGLIGAWEGEGALFGNPAAFSMEWERALDGRFVRLRFENRLVGDDGSETTVLEAIAFYRIGEGDELRGRWFDTRGEIIDLEAAAGESELVTRWISPSEEGRTTYRIVDADTATVTDEVLGDDGYRTFGTSTYRRTAPARGLREILHEGEPPTDVGSGAPAGFTSRSRS